MPREPRNPGQPPSPDPDPDPQPLQAQEDENQGWSGSSAGSSASELLADPGPEFDADQAGQDAQARHADRRLSVEPGGSTGVTVEWAEETVRSLLEAVGAGAHGLAGKAEQDWAFTKTELAAISKPATRILNRYDATRVAAATGDELALILGLLGYVMRSLQERKAALAAQKALEEQDQPAPTRFGDIPQPPIQEAIQ